VGFCTPGFTTTGFCCTTGFAGGAGWRGAAGRLGLAASPAGCAGLALGLSAFRTERIALPGAGFAGAAGAGLLPCFSNERIFAASPSLIELLWLFAAMESFSAASSTSLLSRPKSLDSS